MRLCILFIQLKEAKHVIISCIRLFIIGSPDFDSMKYK